MTAKKDGSGHSHGARDLLQEPDRLSTKIAAIGNTLADLSIGDLYTTLRALQDESVETAERDRREHLNVSGGRKTFETVNDAFEEMLGSQLMSTTGKAQWHRTDLGKAFVEDMHKIINDYCDAVERLRTREARRIRVAATQFMALPVAKILRRWQEALRSRDTQIRFFQIRTAEVFEALRSNAADIVFSGCIIDENGKNEVPDDIEFHKIDEDTISVYTNAPDFKVTSMDEFKDLAIDGHFVFPERGLVRDISDRLEERAKFIDPSRIERCREIFFGASLLEFEILKPGYMIVLSSVRDSILRVYGSSKVYPIPSSLVPERIGIGAFRLRDSQERQSRLKQEHPINICWKIFEKEYRAPK